MLVANTRAYMCMRIRNVRTYGHHHIARLIIEHPRDSLAKPDPTFVLHAEGKVGSGQLTLSCLFRFPEIIGGVSGSAIIINFLLLSYRGIKTTRGSRMIIPVEGTYEHFHCHLSMYTITIRIKPAG